MNNNPASESPMQQIKQPEHVAAGVFATAAVVSHTREEFFLDFIATYSSPFRLVSRVILNPGHVKRLLKALRENLERYREQFGPLPEVPVQKPTSQSQVQDIYAQLKMPETIMAGAYANNVMIRHTQEEFILDFLVVTHPAPVLAARVLVSPAHVQRIANVVEERLKGFAASVGPQEEPPSDSTPAADSEPPTEPPTKPRFSLS